ncbi:MAG: hypothetical protein ACEQSR_16375 [Candidatus Methylacidiphilales bacterium]
MALLFSFPKTYSRNKFIVALVAMYLFFCVAPFESTFDFVLFTNDFKVEGMLSWFLQWLNYYCFIALISFVACVEIKNKLIKAIFFAIIWDSIFNIANLICFSKNYLPIITILRNGSTVLAMLYAYFVLFNETTTWVKNK